MATPELARIPDVAGEIIGYRAWHLDAIPTTARRPLLTSVTRETPWPRGQWMVARCESQCGDVPGEHCSCGIYAANDRNHLLELGYNDDWGGALTVIGEVGLAGKVIIGTQGWRAEKARPVRLWVPYDRWQLARPLAAVYCCRVGLTNTLAYDLEEGGRDGHRA